MLPSPSGDCGQTALAERVFAAALSLEMVVGDAVWMSMLALTWPMLSSRHTQASRTYQAYQVVERASPDAEADAVYVDAHVVRTRRV